jgi:hypothetical protein
MPDQTVRGRRDIEMSAKGWNLHDPSKPIESIEQLEALLVAGLESGEPKPMPDDDWDALRRRAMIGNELRKSG